MLLALLLQAATPVCPATPAPLPPELAGWSPAMLVSATPAGDQAILIGHGVTAALRPSPQVTLAAPVAADHLPSPMTTGGVFTFAVAQAGRYRVALGAGVWIDVVAGGKALTSVAHGHGPACSPVRKMVDFDLQPGRYQLQVVGSPSPVISLMVARLP